MFRHDPAIEDALFAPYRDSIAASAKACAEITFNPSEDLNLWQSKLGGLPYLPLDGTYPHDPKGRPMRLLAQINFAEMPPLPDFPVQGILQFFISRFSEMGNFWGADFDHPAKQGNFRVIYHRDVCTNPDALIRDFPFLAAPARPQGFWRKLAYFIKNGEDDMPFCTPCAMRFHPRLQYVPLEDPACRLKGSGVPVITHENFFDKGFDEFSDYYSACFPAEGHRVGGYASQVQDDIRFLHKPLADYVLLLQIDSEPEKGIMWGDAGVAHFYIHPDDLRRCDFSRTAYSWEC